MKCIDLQFILPLYPDNVLSEDEQSAAGQHMDSCPVCRQRLADLLEVRNNFRSVNRPQLSRSAIMDLRRTVSAKLEAATGRQLFQPAENRRRWVDVWLMPFAVGSISSLVLGFTLLWVIVNGELQPRTSDVARSGSANTTILYPYSPSSSLPDVDLNPLEYANSRAEWSQESPSINPHGSLVALTENLLSEVKDSDEVTVVADIYGNGSATIAQVVEPSSDTRAVNELQRALESSPSSAFVPASFDQRSEPVRVVLKIQSVSVNTKLR